MELNDVLNKVMEAVEELNLQLEEQQQIAVAPDTVLFGKGGKIDSLGLVNLIVILEGILQDAYNLDISLADERAISQKNSPFRTVQSLAEYILALAKEQENV
ncbi:MAG: acyl carrier protein [Anaerolineae bacterium]|nr:acyl carrier protein [Anaerolineae bacterium]